MPRGKPLSTDLKVKLVSYYERNRGQGSLSYKSMSEIFDVPAQTIHDVIKRYLETGSVENKKKTGRPRKTTPRQDRQMVIECKKDPFKCAE